MKRGWVLAAVFVLLVGTIIAWQMRYRLWFDFAMSGWAYVEQEEFAQFIKAVNETGDSWVGVLGYNRQTHDIGLSTARRVKDQPHLAIRIIVFKNVDTGVVRLQAEVVSAADVTDYGDPRIQMALPLEDLEHIARDWLSPANVSKLTEAAANEGWGPVGYNVAFFPKPTIRVAYVEE